MSEISLEAWNEVKAEILATAKNYQNGQSRRRMQDMEYDTIDACRKAGIPWPAIFKTLRVKQLTKYASSETLNRAWTKERELREAGK